VLKTNLIYFLCRNYIEIIHSSSSFRHNVNFSSTMILLLIFILQLIFLNNFRLFYIVRLSFLLQEQRRLSASHVRGSACTHASEHVRGDASLSRLECVSSVTVISIFVWETVSELVFRVCLSLSLPPPLSLSPLCFVRFSD